MGLKNRVTPLGTIIEPPRVELFIGNRGELHNTQRQIVRNSDGKRWICCKKTSKDGSKRPLMDPGSYTVLFFMDEATALSAGHRPCYTCRRTEYDIFIELWLTANPEALKAPFTRIEQIDNYLHSERIATDGGKKTWPDDISSLPDGTFVTFDESPEKYFLVRENMLHLWTPGGYTNRIERPTSGQVTVLTPRSIVNMLAANYKPELHDSLAT